MPHWRVIEATGNSAERRITQLGHSPIAGETQANGAIEEASSPWADTGLALGARPLSQRTGPASSATAYKYTPDAKSAFFSPAIHRVIFSRISSRKRRHPPSPPSYLKDHHSSAQVQNVIDFSTHSIVIYIILCLILP